MASVTLQVDANDQVLQELSGARNIQSEIGRQAFLRIWNNYNFKVKTFQESVVLSYRLLEVRVEAVGFLSCLSPLLQEHLVLADNIGGPDDKTSIQLSW